MVVDADAVVFLYSSGQFRKADSYKAMEFHQDNIFSTRDAGLHKKLKRIISPAFSTQAIAEMEPLVYEIGVENLVKRIDEFSNSGVAFDLLQYLNYMTLVNIQGIVQHFNVYLCVI
ncbi:hypothetical protein BDF19DRAFT_78622 [Syncephalis fuscata]|nr:hypothetical protein BDF19DRAFT_78622 [Syncephalis fuscata]